MLQAWALHPCFCGFAGSYGAQTGTAKGCLRQNLRLGVDRFSSFAEWAAVIASKLAPTLGCGIPWMAGNKKAPIAGALMFSESAYMFG